MWYVDNRNLHKRGYCYGLWTSWSIAYVNVIVCTIGQCASKITRAQSKTALRGNNKTVTSCEFQTRSWTAINFLLFYCVLGKPNGECSKVSRDCSTCFYVYLARDSVGHTSRYISHSQAEESKWEKFLQRNKRRPDLTFPPFLHPTDSWSGRRRGINTPEWRDITREIIKGRKRPVGRWEKERKRERRVKCETP